MAEEKFCAVTGHSCHPNCEFKTERGDNEVCLITECLHSVLKIEGAVINIASYFIRHDIDERMDQYKPEEFIDIGYPADKCGQTEFIDVNAIAKQKGID